MNAKQLKKIHIWIRTIIQLLYFIFIPSVYTAAFAGVKYIFTQIGAGEKVALTSFVTVLIVVYIYCCFRKILLWIRLCIWKSWRWSECIIQTDLQKDEKETGADSGPDCRQTCISEICDSGNHRIYVLWRCIQ